MYWVKIQKVACGWKEEEEEKETLIEKCNKYKNRLAKPRKMRFDDSRVLRSFTVVGLIRQGKIEMGFSDRLPVGNPRQNGKAICKWEMVKQYWSTYLRSLTDAKLALWPITRAEMLWLLWISCRCALASVQVGIIHDGATWRVGGSLSACRPSQYACHVLSYL